MKKKNVVKKDVREKKTLHRSQIRPVKPNVVKKKDEEDNPEKTTQDEFIPRKQKRNRPNPIVEQTGDIENNQ